jgi:hypothetical protein
MDVQSFCALVTAVKDHVSSQFVAFKRSEAILYRLPPVTL